MDSYEIVLSAVQNYLIEDLEIISIIMKGFSHI